MNTNIIDHYIYYRSVECSEYDASTGTRTRNTADRPLDNQTIAATAHTIR